MVCFHLQIEALVNCIHVENSSVPRPTWHVLYDLHLSRMYSIFCAWMVVLYRECFYLSSCVQV
jgi:hypothetical protein